MQVARSVGGGSRRGAKGGVRVDDPKQLFCIRPAIETFADEPPSLVLLVRCASAARCVETLLAREGTLATGGFGGGLCFSPAECVVWLVRAGSCHDVSAGGIC
jgi:hypothetical protein